MLAFVIKALYFMGLEIGKNVKFIFLPLCKTCKMKAE